MSEILKITLLDGYTDSKGGVHKEVEFGRRLLMADMFALDDDPQGQNPTQYQDLIRRRMITKFGSMIMPVPLDVMIGLSSVDRQDLADTADKFIGSGSDGRVSELRDGNQVKLAFGFIVDGTVYDVVQFGAMPTGKDEVEADDQNLKALSRQAFLYGKHIASISTENGTRIDGPQGLEIIGTLDSKDWGWMIAGCELFRIAYRAERRELQKQRDGNSDVPDDETHGNDGGPSTESSRVEA
jgi:hypothetical protein